MNLYNFSTEYIRFHDFGFAMGFSGILARNCIVGEKFKMAYKLRSSFAE